MTWQQLPKHSREQLSSFLTGRNDPGVRAVWYNKRRQPNCGSPADNRGRPIVKRLVLALLFLLAIVSLTSPLLAEDAKQSQSVPDSFPLNDDQLESRLAAALGKIRELEERLAKSEQLAISTRLIRMRERMEGDARGVELIKAKLAAKSSADEAAKLRNELQVAGKRIQDLQARVETANKLADQRDGAESVLREAETKITSLEKAVATAKAETAAANLKLRAALSTLDFVDTGDSDVRSEVLKLKDSLSSSQRLVEEYKASLEKAESARMKAVQELSALQAAEPGQNQVETTPQASAAKEQRIALRQAQTRIKSLQQEIDVSKAETLAAKGKLEAAASKHKTLAVERDRALSQVSMLKQEMRRRVSEGLKAAERKLAQAESSRKEAVEELVKVRVAKQAQQEELREAKAAVDTSAVQAQALRDAAQEAKQQIAVLNKKLANAEVLTAKAIDTQTALRHAEAEIAGLTKAAQDSDAEAATARNRLQAVVSRLDELVSHKQRAQSEISELKASLAAAARDAKQKEAELSKLAASGDLAKATAIEEAARAGAVMKAKDDNLRDAVDELAKVKTELRVANETAESSKAQADVLRKTLAERKRQLRELRSTLDTAMTEVRQARSEITQRIDRMIEVATTPHKSQIDNLKSNLAAANAEIERLKVLLRKKPLNPEG